jgi:hypothetical protein
LEFYNILIQLGTLSQTSNAVLQQNNVDNTIGNKNNHSVYFLRGNDPNLLSFEHQQEIVAFINKDNLSSSILVYNPT